MRPIHAAAVALVAASFFSSCVVSIGGSSGTQYVHGSGVRVSEERVLTGFERIDVSGTFRLNVRVGEPHRVVLHGDDNLLDYVRARVDNGRLKVELKGARVSGAQPITVEVCVPTLRSLDVSGSCRFEVVGLDAERFDVDVSGSTRGSAAGRAKHLVIDVSGSAELDFFALEAGEVDLDVSGGAKVFVSAERRLDTDVSGSAAVRYRGRPAMRTHISGSGSVLADKQ